MAEYHFLAALLPPLEIGHVPTLGFPELKELIKVNLTPQDWEEFRTLLLLVDFENFRSLWSGEPLDPRGNYTKEELQQSLIDLSWPNNVEFPLYLKDYLQKYPTDAARFAHFPQLMSTFLDVEKEKHSGFIKEYFTFEREWRLVMTGFRAKKLGKNIDLELQYEDPEDPIVAQVLAQKDAKVFEPPFEYKELKPIFEAYEDSPAELQKALIEYRFGKIIEFQNAGIFSLHRLLGYTSRILLDHILGYTARLMIVENWMELDVQQGLQTIDIIEKNVG